MDISKNTEFNFEFDWETIKRGFEYWALTGFTKLPSKTVTEDDLTMLKIYVELTKKGR